MQLRHARLCLNCEEIHSGAHCPVCASESFAYVSRWIPPSERRQAPRAPDAERPTTGSAASIAAEPSSRRMRWVKRGAAGVAIVAASRLLWQMSRPVEWSSSELPAELEDPEVGDEPS